MCVDKRLAVQVHGTRGPQKRQTQYSSISLRPLCARPSEYWPPGRIGLLLPCLPTAGGAGSLKTYTRTLQSGTWRLPGRAPVTRHSLNRRGSGPAASPINMWWVCAVGTEDKTWYLLTETLSILGKQTPRLQGASTTWQEFRTGQKQVLWKWRGQVEVGLRRGGDIAGEDDI